MRPSVNATLIITSSNSTDLANAVEGTYERGRLGRVLAEVLIPSLQESVTMLIDKFLDLVQLATVETVIGGQLDRVEPELDLIATRFDVDMWRLLPLVAVEEEPESPDA